MGSYISRRMNEDDLFETSTSSAGDSESEHHTSDDSQVFQRIHKNSNPFKKRIANTEKLVKSEFFHTTSISSGASIDSKNEFNNNVAAMVVNREIGNYKVRNFCKATRCKISNSYLPNSMERLDVYNGKVFCGTFSKDGNYFITTSQDQWIRLYKTDNGRYNLIKVMHARDVGWSIIDIAFSPDREHFVYSTWSTALHLCPVNGGPDIQEPLCLVNTARRFCVFSLAFSSDGNEILGGANDGILCIYDRQRHSRTFKIAAHEYDINTVAFADDSSHIIYSGSDDGLIKVWDRRTLGEESNPKPVGVLAGHYDGITFINPKGDGRHLISNSKDQSIKLWDVRVFSSEGAAKNTLKAVHEQTWDYRWQGVPKRLCTIKDRLEGDTSIMTYKGHFVTRTLIRCRFSPLETTGQRYIYTGCGLGRLLIYDALTGEIKMDEKRHDACVRDVSWHPYNNEILTSSWDTTVGRWFFKYKENKVKYSEKKRNPESLRRSERLATKKRREMRMELMQECDRNDDE